MGQLGATAHPDPADDMWSRLSRGRAKRRPDRFSGAASSGRLRVDVVACVSVRDGAVMLICAGWLPQDGAVRLERFCWSRDRA